MARMVPKIVYDEATMAVHVDPAECDPSGKLFREISFTQGDPGFVKGFRRCGPFVTLSSFYEETTINLRFGLTKD